MTKKPKKPKPSAKPAIPATDWHPNYVAFVKEQTGLDVDAYHADRIQRGMAVTASDFCSKPENDGEICQEDDDWVCRCQNRACSKCKQK